MAWVVISRDNRELIFDNEPEYDIKDNRWKGVRIPDKSISEDDQWFDFAGNLINHPIVYYGIELPHGTIEKLICKTLTWLHGPVELK